MGWNTKYDDGPAYYYRSERVNGRVIKKYFGRGPLAKMMARLDESHQRKRHRRRQAQLALQVRLAAAEAALDELRGMAELLAQATLILAGWYMHKGEWRKRRQRSHGRAMAWLDLLAGGDHLVMESAKCYVAAMKAQLGGSAPTPLESLLLDHAGTTWLAMKYSEMHAAKPGRSGLGEANLKLKQAESAQKRHLGVLKMLALVRSLVPVSLGQAEVRR